MKTMKISFRFFGVIAFAVITVFLIAGCNINVTTGSSGPKTPVAGDFTVSNLTQYADNVTEVTVAPKTGKSGGTVTVYYNGSTSLPNGAGSYTVTFDVAAASGWNVATGLHGGKLMIIPPGQTLVDGLEDASAYLSAADGGESAEDSVYLLVNVDLEDTAADDSGWQQLLNAIDDADKFIELDLSLCEMTGTEFDPVSSLSTGKDKIISITLPAVAKSIKNGDDDPTFNNFENLTTVRSAYVTSVGGSAFSGCSNLIEVSFPLAKYIGYAAFAGCSSLTEASFPLAESTGTAAFYDCSSLTEVNFPLAKSIERQAFYGCSSLTEANFQLVESIDRFAIAWCSSLTEANFPLAAIVGGDVFCGCSSLTEVNIPLAESIGSGAFRYCSSLTEVDFPLTKSIGDQAFAGCSNLVEANFPLAESVGYQAFSGCDSLVEANFPLAEIIGGNAFGWCSNLIEMSFPASAYIDGNPFTGCTALISINLTGNGDLSLIADGKALVKNITGGMELIAYLSATGSISMDDIISIGDNAFYLCSNLTEADFPLAKNIGDNAFISCDSLTEANFPLAESIGDQAFAGCSNLVEVNFPLVEIIGDSVFASCNSLTSITIAADCDIDSGAGIRGNFSDYYDSQSKAAGTYTYNGSAWMGPF